MNKLRKTQPASICDKCGNKTYIIFITRNHEKLCDYCYDKIRNKNEWERIQEENKKWKNS